MMNRREFCKKMAAYGGVFVLAPLLDACAPSVTPTPQTRTVPPTATSVVKPIATSTVRPIDTSAVAPTDTPAPMPAATSKAAPTMATIALVKTRDRAIGVRQALDLFGINPVRGRQVLLKPNFNSADPAPGSTHNEVLSSLMASLSDMGATAVTVADRSGMGDTRQVMSQKDIFALTKHYGGETVVFEELPEDAWFLFEADDLHWTRGIPVPKMLMDAETVVQTCNLKTHRYGGHFTLSLKNSVGFVAKHYRSHNYMNELHGSAYQRHMIAETNAVYQPALLVMDGVEAFVSGGPANGQKVAPEVVLVGTDRVAMDAVGVALLRYFGTTPEVSRGAIFEQEQIARAVELGLGVTSPDQIELLTADADSGAFASEIKALLQM